MEDVLVRTATEDDVAILQIFEQGVITAERPFDGSFKQETIH